MSRYALNLPTQLKQEASEWATNQGVSLNQFILWAVAEKVGFLRNPLDDPAFPQITYRRGASGKPLPVLRGRGIRVQTISVAAHQWGMLPAQIAEEYGITQRQVEAALAFYQAHQIEIDADIAVEHSLEVADGKN